MIFRRDGMAEGLCRLLFFRKMWYNEENSMRLPERGEERIGKNMDP